MGVIIMKDDRLYYNNNNWDSDIINSYSKGSHDHTPEIHNRIMQEKEKKKKIKKRKLNNK